MKVRKLVWPMFLFCVVLTACEEKTEGEGEKEAIPAEGVKPAEAPPPAPPPPPKEPAMPPPAEVCTSLINAIKAKDEAKVLSLSAPTTPGALGSEGAKEHLMTTLAAANCGAAKVEGDNATVAVTAEEVNQDLPFVKAADGWKFDGAAYLSKYPPADKAAKNAKGKNAKLKGKVKGKGKHKK